MDQIVLVIHIFIALGLISVVLMQKSEGGGTGFGGSSGSMTGFLSSRSKANILTKAKFPIIEVSENVEVIC